MDDLTNLDTVFSDWRRPERPTSRF